MKLEIPPTKLLIAIFACTLSIVSTANHSILDDADRITRNAAALPKSVLRRYIDVPESLHVVRRSAQQNRSSTRVKHRYRRPVVINITRDQPDAFDFDHPPEYEQIIEKFYLTNLHTADRLAENTVSIFGLILESPNNGLTFDQYSSLEIIHNAIKRRQFQMYRLLKVLNLANGQSCISQFYLIIFALSTELPPYLACAASFLVSQIDLHLLDFNTLKPVIKDLNFLTGINEIDIAYGGLYTKEMEQNGYDYASRVTEEIIGPYFVHIFALMSNHSLIVSQPLFASILLNLPNRDGDPVFNEYVRLMAKIAWEGKIPKWSAKSYTPAIGDDIYSLIDAMVFMICHDPDVTYDMKQALWYIRNHFARTVKHIVALSADEADWASKDGIHIYRLFALITPQEFSPHANLLKAQLIKYIVSHQPVIQKTLVGMNSHGYPSPKHLLLAFLTRLRIRLPAEEIQIRKSVSALLSILMLKRQAWNFHGLRKDGITLWTLLDTMNDSEINPEMAELVQTILNELLGKVELWPYIWNMKLNYMNKCGSAEVCLREMLQILVERLPLDSLSPEIYIMIKKLIDMITVEIDRECIPVVPKEPPVHYDTTTIRSGTSEPHSEGPSVHYDTTTVRQSIPGISEPHSEEPPVHYNTTTVGPSVLGTSEPHSEQPPVHTTTVRPSVPGTSVPHSEQPPVHTTTVRPSVPGTSEPHSEQPPVHTTTVRPFLPGISEPHSEQPPVHTTAVRPFLPGISQPHSEQPPVHTTTVGPSVPGTNEPHSEEPPVHTTTVRPSIPGISEPHSEQPPVHTTTVRPFLPGISEPHSEQPPVHRTTVGPSVPGTSEPHSEQPPVHTTTVRPSIPGISEPHSEQPPVHTTTVRPSIPGISEPHSEQPPVHTTTVRPSIPGISEPHSEQPALHTTTVRPFLPGTSEPHSEQPPVHTTTAGPSVPGTREPHSEAPPVHYGTTTVRPSIPGTSEPHSAEPLVHTTTVGPSVPGPIEPQSEEPPVRVTTIRPSIPETSEPHSEEPPLHYVTTTIRSTVHRPRENQTTENPDEYIVTGDTVTQRRPPSDNYLKLTTARPLITTTNEVISSVLPMETNKPLEGGYPMPINMLPPSVNPEKGMHVDVPDSGFTPLNYVRIDENSHSPNTVTIPSIVCLQKTPSADELKGECEKGLIPIKDILIPIFGEDYIQVLLGDEWRVRYPTRISFYVALLKKAEESGKLSTQPNDLRIITRYKVALSYVLSYVLLPLIASSKNLTTGIVWSTYNPKDPSECNIGSDRPHELGENALTLPLVNPASWLLPVDTAHPFANLLPQLPPDDPYAVQIQPLTELCNTGNIYQYLGSDWNPSQYTNRGALFTSVLHILLKLESVQSNPQLYEVVRRYVIAIEGPTQYIHISRSYVERVITQYTYYTMEIHDRIAPPTSVWNEASIQSLTNFVSLPLIQKLPTLVYPGISIHVKVSSSGIAHLESPNSPASSDVVFLPSFDCLLNKPRPEDNPESRCQRDLIPISQPLIHIFGANYIQVILGNIWESLYPTRISLLVALLTAAEQNPKCQTETELIAVINRYRAACEFVASYVLLPIVVDSQDLKTVTVWSTFDLAYLWRSTIGSHEADGFGPDAVSLPLTNPKIWLTEVDASNPFAYLLPHLPENDTRSITIQPLDSLFASGKIMDLLGSNWKPTDYPDRGSLFVSVLRTLLTLEVVKSNQELYTLVFHYLMALELPALYVHVPHSYVKTIFDQYNVPWMEERYMESIEIPNNIPLPPLINPKKILQVIVPESGAPVIESVRSKKLQSKIATILPSVNCLQGASTADDDEDAGDTCDSVLEFRLTEPLIEVFGEEYVETILGADWHSLYPTRISFLAGLLRNAVKNKIILEDPNHLHKKVKSFKEALEVAAPYIFLPMLANYQKLVTPIVWLTYNYDKPWQSHMGRNPPQYLDNSTVTLPLINPKVWYLPVNRHHPFSGFLPDFPSTNPYEERIAPLRSVLTLEYLRNLTGSGWDPSQYPNRGVFFVSAMHSLLNLGPSTMNAELYSLVRSYYMAIEIPSLYIHIPRSYINNAVKTAAGAWNVDLDGLIVALMEARTVEERRYRTILHIFLKQEDLLQVLGIALPSSTTMKHVFLLTIIKAALSSTTIQLTADTIMALKACQTHILTTGAGAEVVGWIWVSRVIVTTLIDLTNMVTVIIPIERIPEDKRAGYYELLQYFKDHRDLLKTNDFPTYRYHTNGAFLRGYLNHLVYKSRVSEEARENIELVIPYIRYTGPGAEPVFIENMNRVH